MDPISTSSADARRHRSSQDWQRGRMGTDNDRQGFDEFARDRITRYDDDDDGDDQDTQDDSFIPDIDFSFSFNEDSLIPSKLSWHGSDADLFNHATSVSREGDAESSPSIYSKPPVSESKITVSRALVVQQPGPKEQSSARNKRQNNTGGSSARSSATPLSRTWSNLRNSTKRGRPPQAVFTPHTLNGVPQRPVNALQSSQSETLLPRRQTSPNKVENGTGSDDTGEASKRTFSLRKKSTKTGSGSKTAGLRPESPPPPPPRLTPSSARRPPTAQEPEAPFEAPMPSLANTQDAGIKDTSRTEQPVPSRYRNNGPRITRQKDQLWSAFKALDTDFQKFQSKPSALKVNTVKSNLLPFLRTYADHPSNSQLRPEDLDRRATILDKWWSAILVILNSRNNQTVSGADRPVLLDAVSAIMDRPEWKLPQVTAEAIDADTWPDGEQGDSSDTGFFIESVLHNVRNLFVKNLFNQIAMAVERMSMRHAPASLVAFCGRCCAYAFFHCQGVADVLVRLWGIPARFVKQVVATSQVTKESRLAELSETVCSAFPRAVHDLGFKSYRRTIADLKKKPLMPLGLEKIQWQGQWLSRWQGRDSDLFFSFSKHFHALLADFLPLDASPAERACAPGYLLVQAQMLVNLDSTINRASKPLPPEPGVDVAVTFDDLMSPDTAASGLPLAPLNASRMMAENRVVLLLQQVLGQGQTTHSREALLFAQSMCGTVKACAQMTSMYNQNSCFVLCDFLQEFFDVVLKFEGSSDADHDIVDWDFWLDVFHKMLQSQNTMTEIRLYALLYASWDILTATEKRKSKLCLDLLLSEQNFASAFYHWCPMVRAYCMRLICWRIARFDGDASETEMLILKTLMSRLQTAWHHFKLLVGRAHDEQRPLPSSAPCNPAPGRRLLIIRTDTLASNGGLPEGGTARALNAAAASAKAAKTQTLGKSIAAADETIGPSILERLASTIEQSNDTARRKSGMLRSWLTTRGSSPSKDTRGEGENGSEQPYLLESSESSAEDHSRSRSPERGDSRGSMYEQRPIRALAERTNSSNDKKTAYSKAVFKFSLEFVDRGPNNTLADMRLVAPRVPLAAQLLLQAQPDYSADSEARVYDIPTLAWTYVGRALAEWTLVVNECQNFFIRRRNEGVPTNKLVETPSLGVESFKRPG